MFRQHLPSWDKVVAAVAIGVSIGILAIVGFEGATKYPSPDGYRMKDGQLLGGDFVAFYTGAALFRTAPERLYALDQQGDARREVLGTETAELVGDLPFIYPPLVAAAMSPLSRLPFEQAFYLWTFIGFSVSCLSLLALIRVAGTTQFIPLPLLMLCLLAFVPFSFQTFFGGQISWLGLTILALTATALLREQDLLAGALLSLSYYKPPLFVFFLVVLLLSRRREFAMGFALGACVIVGATFLIVGFEGVRDYLASATRYVYGRELMAGIQLPPDQGVGLWALGVTFLSSMAATAAVLALPILYTGRLAHRLLTSADAPDRLFGLILALTASLAFSVQLINYDLALLLVPMLLGLAWLGGRPMRDGVALLPFAGFYLEAGFRGLRFSERSFNASSLLFVLLLCTLVWKGRQLVRASARTNSTDPVGR